LFFFFNFCILHFIILYNDQQMHNYFTNYHTPKCFDKYRVILRELVLNTLPSYTGISNAAVGNTVLNYDVTKINIQNKGGAFWQAD